MIPAILLAAAAIGGPSALVGQVGGFEAPPFIATPDQLVRLMLDVAEVKEDEIVYDLGSGDGRLVIAAARRGARAVGVEYDGGLVERSRENARRSGIAARATFIHGDIFETDVAGADVVMLYLSPEFNLRLRQTLLQRLEPGSRVVSHAFHMGDWRPDESVTVGEGAARATVYRWTVPASVDGFWALEVPGLTGVAVELSQTFQQLDGQAWIDGHPVGLRGRVDGWEVEFELVGASGGEGAPLRFRGKLAEGVLTGTTGGTLVREPARAVAVRFSHPSRAPL